MISISTELSGVLDRFEKIPIGFVEVYDTSNTVPSSGLFVRYYSGVNPNLTGNIRRTQFEPIIMKDWSNGLPVELSNYVGARISNSGLMVSDPFSIVYSGYFYAEAPGFYNFATRSNGGTELFIDNVNALSGFVNITPTFSGMSSGMWSNKPFYWQGTRNLTAGWHDFKLNFYWYSQISGLNQSPFLGAYYTVPGSIEKNIGAGVVNTFSGFLQPVEIGKVIQLKESFEENLAAQFEFEVTVIRSGEYQWNKAKEDFGKLKLNRLCNIYMGYVTESGYWATSGYTTNIRNANGMVRKFTGLIDSVNVSHNYNSITANVRCRDFFKKLKNTINDNFPNRVNYSRRVLSGIDPSSWLGINSTMPNAYDTWPVFDVIETMALNAGVDPTHINRGKWDIQNYFALESNLNYPFTSTYDLNGVETKDGDPFIFQLPYGENLSDHINKISDLVGYNLYFDEVGDLVFKDPRRTNKVEVYESGTYGSKSVFYSGFWNMEIDSRASNRIYMAPVRSNPQPTGIRVTFSGVGFGLYNAVHTSGANYNIKIIRNSNNLEVFNSNYTNSGTSLRFGVLQETTRDLPFDGYSAYIFPSGNLYVEGFEYYTSNIYKPTYTVRDARDIENISVDLNDYTVRNEVIAVGQQISDKGYKYSKAIDLDSISNPDAFNYVGDKRTFTLIEPTIQSQQRLDWLSKNLLERFRAKQRNITITTQGLPHLQIGDPVGIKDGALLLDTDNSGPYNSNNTEVYYITNLSSTLAQANYKTSLTLTSLKPIESWKPRIGIPNDVLRRIYDVNDNTIFANFTQDTINSPVGPALTGYGYDGFSEQAAFMSFDLLVDVDRLWVLIGDAEDGGNLFKAIDTRVKSPLLTYTTATDPNNNSPRPQGGVWLHNGGGERWGRITVPTAQNDFNGGQWAGQNSLSNVRLDGKYPMAIWAQFRTAEGTLIVQNIWVPLSGTLDNRNRAQAWTNTSGNTYINYQYTTGGQLTLTPVNASLQQRYVPAFVVKNTPLEIDMWVGPIESGYQMIAANRLLDMSSKFTHHGQYWNPAGNLGTKWLQPAANNYTLTNFDTNLYPVVNSAVGSLVVAASTGPWVVGDVALLDGSPPNVTAILAAINEVFYNYPGSLTPRTTKSVFGFANQGFDFNNKSRDQKGYLSGWQPPDIRYPGNQPETINHTANYFVIKPNRDVYINYQACAIGAQYQTYGQPLHVAAQLGAYDVFDVNLPIREPFSIYLTPGSNSNYDVNIYGLPSGTDMGNNYVWGINIKPFDPDNGVAGRKYRSYHGNLNVLNYPPDQPTIDGFSYFSAGSDFFKFSEPMTIHHITLTEAKSGRKYFLCMRTNTASATSHIGFSAPYGLRYLNVPNMLYHYDYCSPRVI